MKSVVVLVALAACDPGWAVRTTLRDPANRRIADATLAVACPDGHVTPYVARSDRDGNASTGSIGPFPHGCDVFVSKPGYRTQHFAYSALCPSGGDCMELYRFDLILEEQQP